MLRRGSPREARGFARRRGHKSLDTPATVAVPPRLLKVSHLAFQIAIGFFLCGALFVVLFLPFLSGDALSYGEWSRLIAHTGDYHFPTVTPLMYQRPLLYVSQGWLWRVIGFDDASGRALCLAFGVLLGVAVWRLSREVFPDPLNLSSYVGVAVLISIPGVSAYVCSGLSDVPVAAMVACVAAVLWTLPVGVTAATLVLLTSCLAVLAKPTALPAIVGLGLAHAIGSREGLTRRVVFGCAPLTVGMGLGLLYDFAEAHRGGLSLNAFLMSPLSGYYERMSAESRFAAVWDWTWLGPNLRFPLVLSVFYACLRALGQSQRRALRIATSIALFMCWFGPWIASGRGSLRVGLFTPGRFLPFSLVAMLGPALLAGACFVNQHDTAVSRVSLIRLVVWATPPVLSWLLLAAYDARLLAAAWPPLALLICAAVAPPVLAAFESRRLIGILALLAIVVLAGSSVQHLEGLEREGWGRALYTVAQGRVRQSDFRRALSPDLADLVEALTKRVGAAERIFSPDGTLRFFFPGRVSQSYPRSCQDLAGFNYFVLQKGPWMENYFVTQVGVPGTVEYWASCTSPSLELIAETRHDAIFRVAQGK